jgi:hypothetical protein
MGYMRSNELEEILERIRAKNAMPAMNNVPYIAPIDRPGNNYTATSTYNFGNKVSYFSNGKKSSYTANAGIYSSSLGNSYGKMNSAYGAYGSKSSASYGGISSGQGSGKGGSSGSSSSSSSGSSGGK